MEPTKKAVQAALKFMEDAVGDPEMPPETRRKCAETLLSRDSMGGNSTTNAPAVSVTYQIIE